jgi:uncharacterized membrane protein
MKNVNWLIVGIISIVVVLLLFGGGMMMGSFGGWNMMGGYGMMGNGGYSPFGGFGMIFTLLIAVGLIALAVFGVVWLLRKAGKSTPPSSKLEK